MTQDDETTEKPKTAPTMDLPSFLRLFEKRAANIMWFLGAGASRSAGIKTGWDMIWDFKRSIYRSHKKIPASALPDNADWKTRKLLQDFFDNEEGFPPANDPSEYAAYFEAAYPSEMDRRRYIEEMVGKARPSFGHHALAALMDKGLCQIVWTTNFDRVLEDATAKRFDTTARLKHAGLGEPDIVKRAIDEAAWPVYAKIHGDFQNIALKNTQGELAAQDEIMRDALIDACQSRGLAVAGYSGRDVSVMDALRTVIDKGGFRQGLFWFQRTDSETFESVANLISYAREKDIEAFIVSAESFDEVLSDIVAFVPAMDEETTNFRDEKQGRRAKINRFEKATTFPVIRTNAFPVVSYPQIARLVDCEVGGFKEIREAVEKAEADIVSARVRPGVIAFGADEEIRGVFNPFGIENWDTHPILPERLAFESGEKTLLREALFRGLSQDSGLRILRRRGENLFLADPETTSPKTFSGLKYPLSAVAGTVGNTGLKWYEACAVRLDFRLERLWLLLDPTVVVEWPENADKPARDQAKEFIRRRLATRYNNSANSMLDGWKKILIGDGDEPILLNAVPHKKGLGASFELSPVSGFSGRVK